MRLVLDSFGFSFVVVVSKCGRQFGDPTRASCNSRNQPSEPKRSLRLFVERGTLLPLLCLAAAVHALLCFIHTHTHCTRSKLGSPSSTRFLSSCKDLPNSRPTRHAAETINFFFAPSLFLPLLLCLQSVWHRALSQITTTTALTDPP